MCRRCTLREWTQALTHAAALDKDAIQAPASGLDDTRGDDDVASDPVLDDTHLLPGQRALLASSDMSAVELIQHLRTQEKLRLLTKVPLSTEILRLDDAELGELGCPP